jgi:hypothetical protein
VRRATGVGVRMALWPKVNQLVNRAQLINQFSSVDQSTSAHAGYDVNERHDVA